MAWMPVRLAAIALAASALACSAAQAAVTFYTTQAAFNAASTTSLLEDFSTAAPKDALLTSLTLNGVTYTGYAGTPFANVFVSSPGYTNYGAAVGPTTDNILTANGDEDIVADFPTPYTAVGFNAFYNGLGDGKLSVFGAGNSLLGSFTFLGGLDPATGLPDKGYLGFTSTTAVEGFEWLTTRGGTLNTGFTNISVGTASGVPEPGSWALTICGLLGLGAALRRRRLQPNTQLCGS